jgi:hypothetical protein
LIHVQEGLVRELPNITKILEKKDSNLPVLTFNYCFGHNWSYIINFDEILVAVKSRHSHISHDIW